MAPHSSTLAWKIPWTEEPSGVAKSRTRLHFHFHFNHLKGFLGGASGKNLPANARDVSSLSSVQSLSCVRLFETPWTAACQASLSLTYSWSLLKLMAIELVSIESNFIVGL